MRKLLFFFLFLSLSLNVGCKKDTLELLPGNWILDELTENGNQILIAIPVELELKTNGKYRKINTTGSWFLNDDFLTLAPDDMFNLPAKLWEIKELTDSKLILSNSTAGGFEPILTEEIYRKE